MLSQPSMLYASIATRMTHPTTTTVASQFLCMGIHYNSFNGADDTSGGFGTGGGQQTSVPLTRCN